LNVDIKTSKESKFIRFLVIFLERFNNSTTQKLIIMANKRGALILIYSLCFLLIIQSVFAEFDLYGSMTDLSEKFVEITRDSSIIAYVTLVLFFIIIYAIFSAAMKMMPMFKEGDDINRAGKTISIILAVMTCYAVFKIRETGGVSNFDEVLMHFAFFGAIVIALVIALVFMVGLSEEKTGTWWLPLVFAVIVIALVWIFLGGTATVLATIFFVMAMSGIQAEKTSYYYGVCFCVALGILIYYAYYSDTFGPGSSVLVYIIVGAIVMFAIVKILDWFFDV